MGRVEPSKGAIKSWLKGKNLRDKDLIEGASKEALERSFPGIVAVIRRFIEMAESD
jgi:hypothetical protein